MTVILKNPLRTKQLQQGLEQLGEEGAIQVFKPEAGGAMLLFRRELGHVANPPQVSVAPVPLSVMAVHLVFLAIVVLFSHHPAVFMGVFLFFLGFSAAYQRHQDPLILREALLVAFFLGGLVVLGGMQQWWLQPLLLMMDETQVFFGAVALTAITDNAALTYLGSLVPGLSDEFKLALVAGAVGMAQALPQGVAGRPLLHAGGAVTVELRQAAQGLRRAALHGAGAGHGGVVGQHRRARCQGRLQCAALGLASGVIGLRATLRQVHISFVAASGLLFSLRARLRNRKRSIAIACTCDSSFCRASRESEKPIWATVMVWMRPATALMRATSRPSMNSSAWPCQPVILPAVP